MAQIRYAVRVSPRDIKYPRRLDPPDLEKSNEAGRRERSITPTLINWMNGMKRRNVGLEYNNKNNNSAPKILAIDESVYYYMAAETDRYVVDQTHLF